MNAPPLTLALLNLGGGEIVLILVLLLVLGMITVAVAAVVYAIVRAVQNRPPPVPTTLQPEAVAEHQRKRDSEHLKLLWIFHLVFAGFALLGIGFLLMHYTFMHSMFSNPEKWNAHREAMPPKEFLDAFVWFYLFMGVILLLGFVLNVMSAVFIWQQRHRIFSLVVAALDCFQIPFGTALGVFTIVVLSRESVRQQYLE
jgi:hypothetical protein